MLTNQEWDRLSELAHDAGYLILECDEENESALIRAGFKGGAGTLGLRPQFGPEGWSVYQSAEEVEEALTKGDLEISTLTSDVVEERLEGMRGELIRMVKWARANSGELGRHDLKRLGAALDAVSRCWSYWKHNVDEG